MHVNPTDEHGIALHAFMGLAEAFAGSPQSILDVGAGTGRGMKKLKARWPTAFIIGVEPVEALRDIGHKNGLRSDELIDGDALQLKFPDDSFDFVIETGILHHIREPELAVREMVRVAKRGVMISDNNNIGAGSRPSRIMKGAIKAVGLWPAFIFLQTGGKMYKFSEGDGLYYSFSAFDCVDELKTKFLSVFYMNTKNSDGFNAYRSASHVMIFASSSDVSNS
jgi:ubiquinone/menaquinone biosynthesis C-methylase UbiE